MVRFRIISLLILSGFLYCHAIDTSTGAKDERIRSLTARHTGGFSLPAVVSENSRDAIEISFDILGETAPRLRYKLVHCNADWQPSSLSDHEILDGFNEFHIDEGEYSQGTTVNYTHYSFLCLNENERPKFPGNYLVKIYDEDNPDWILAQIRTGLTSDMVNIKAKVSGVTDIDYNERNQQLGIEADILDNNVENLYNDLILTIAQNDNQNRIRTIRHPLRVSGKTAVYRHLPELIFEGGNEYRRFESVSTMFNPMGVKTVKFSEPYYRYLLETDIPRAGSSYLYDQTQRGRFLVRNAELREDGFPGPDTGADYAIVYFSLQSPALLTDVCVVGEFNSEKADENSKMNYNPVSKAYEKAFLLKQGAYNYRYVCLDSQGRESNCVDGNYYNTRNDYVVKVYSRRRGERADRLIGTRVIDSTENSLLTR